MKYLFIWMGDLLFFLFQVSAFLVIMPFVTVYCLWDFDFQPVKTLKKDFNLVISDTIYRLFKVKTKYYGKPFSF